MDILIPLLMGGCELPAAAAVEFLVPAKRMAVSLLEALPLAMPAAGAADRVVMAPPLLARRMIRVLSGDGNW